MIACQILADLIIYVDQARENTTDIVVRAIHDIPEDREVCLSYFPITWRFLERQTYVSYRGSWRFRCECDRRVVLEKDWSDDDDDKEKEDEDEGMEEDFGDEAMENMDTCNW